MQVTSLDDWGTFPTIMVRLPYCPILVSMLAQESQFLIGHELAKDHLLSLMQSIHRDTS